MLLASSQLECFRMENGTLIVSIFLSNFVVLRLPVQNAMLLTVQLCCWALGNYEITETCLSTMDV
jgi:hypothetical protein